MTKEELLKSLKACVVGLTAESLERRLSLYSMSEVEAWVKRQDAERDELVAMIMHSWLFALGACSRGFVPEWPMHEEMPAGCSILLYHLKGQIEFNGMAQPESLTPEAGLLNRWCGMTADQRIAWLIELGTALAAHVAARS